MDVVVAWNKIQLVIMDKCELKVTMLKLLLPPFLTLLFVIIFGDYHIPQGEIKIGPVRVELKRRHRGLRPLYR